MCYFSRQQLAAIPWLQLIVTSALLLTVGWIVVHGIDRGPPGSW